MNKSPLATGALVYFVVVVPLAWAFMTSLIGLFTNRTTEPVENDGLISLLGDYDA